MQPFAERFPFATGPASGLASTCVETAEAARAPAIRALAARHVVEAGSYLLLLPNVIFAVHLRAIPAAVMAVAIAGSATLLHLRVREDGSPLEQPLDLPRLCLCFVLAFGLLVLGGEGHFLFANWDWLWRDAVLADLARAPFPPTYRVADATYILRAPLGMYMLPMLAAKATSLEVGHLVLLAQNSLFLALVLYLIMVLAGRRAVLVVAIFVSFSGLDALGELIMWLRAGHDLSSFVLPSHLESWIGLQYSSTVTQLFWAPNHALPSYWLALLALLCARRELDVGALGLAMAAAMLWSPFALIGAAPFLVYLFARDLPSILRSVRFRCSALVALCFVAVPLYLQVDTAGIPRAFVLFEPAMVATILLFLVVEIPHAWVVKEVWASLEPSMKGLLGVAIGVLVVLPTMRFGDSNDLVMRASIPSLTLLAFGFAEALLVARRARPGLAAAGAVFVFVGAMTPLQEIGRAVTFSPFAISDCDLVTVWKKVTPDLPVLGNYLARTSRLPSWLMAPSAGPVLVDRPQTLCWPDLPYGSYTGFTVRSTRGMLEDAGHGPQLRL